MLEVNTSNGKGSDSVWKGGSRKGKMQQHRSRVEVTKAPSVMTPKVTTSNNFGGHLQKFNIREFSAAIGIWGKNFLAVDIGLHSDSGPPSPVVRQPLRRPLFVFASTLGVSALWKRTTDLAIIKLPQVFHHCCHRIC